jgi:hypothetical protein
MRFWRQERRWTVNAYCKAPSDLLQPVEAYLIHNRTQGPIIIKDPIRVSPNAVLKHDDGPIEARVLPRPEGVEPWWVFPTKGSCGLPRAQWLKLLDDDVVEIKRVTAGGWEDFDAKK